MKKPMDHATLAERLDQYYKEIDAVIISRQNPVTGLFPASTAKTTHGDYTHAWVRDNVYTVLAVWGLALAYRKIDDDKGRAYELEQRVVKLMRGLLFCMMRQTHKVEAFKQTAALTDALHAKYSTSTGDTVVGDRDWGHLQIDATSIFVLMLAQMTASGFSIIYTKDEVAFIQNLVYYIERAYRVPDFGIWERGNKMNHGKAELNSSSIGMAKAALEAINGINLFGARGDSSSVIHVLADEIANNHATLCSMLPRESFSKETDAALLSVIGFPAFAVEDQELIERTRSGILEKLKGEYGCKRFLRDGHQTMIEDTSRLHYEPRELERFENIESEWPLFYTYLLLDALFREDEDGIKEYKERIDKVAVELNGMKLLPELYFVPLENIEEERRNPHSQPRLPNANLPLVWAQSLYYLGMMLDEGILDKSELDPLGRHKLIGRKREPIVQIALLAEDEELQTMLGTAHGIDTQVPSQIQPFELRHPSELLQAYHQLGTNKKLNLTGRPLRPMGSLSTSRILRINGVPTVFFPSFEDAAKFYLSLDIDFFADMVRSEIAYLRSNWRLFGRPTMTLLLTHQMFEGPDGRSLDDGACDSLLKLISEMKQGEVNGTRVRLGRLHELMLTAANENIDYLYGFKFGKAPITNGRDAMTTNKKRFLKLDTHAPSPSEPTAPLEQPTLATPKGRHIRTHSSTSMDDTTFGMLVSRLKESDNILDQIEILYTLVRAKGLSFQLTDFGDGVEAVSLQQLVDEVYDTAGKLREWAVVRLAAGLTGKVVNGLGPAVTSLLIHGKDISVGKSTSEDSVISTPLTTKEITDKIEQYCPNIRERVLSQEIIIYLAMYIKSEPKLFNGLLRLNLDHIITALANELAMEHVQETGNQKQQWSPAEAYEHLTHLSPFEISNRVYQILSGYQLFNHHHHHQNQAAATAATATTATAAAAAATTTTPATDLKETTPTAHVIDNHLVFDPHIRRQSLVARDEEDFWRRVRQLDGVLHRVPPDFYPTVYSLLKHARGGLNLTVNNNTRHINSSIVLSDMTPGEKNFALKVEWLLIEITQPAYRQIVVEALMALASFFEREVAQGSNNIVVNEVISLDALVHNAMMLCWRERNKTTTTTTKGTRTPTTPATPITPSTTTTTTTAAAAAAALTTDVIEDEQVRQRAWSHFYATEPRKTDRLIISAFHALYRFDNIVA